MSHVHESDTSEQTYRGDYVQTDEDDVSLRPYKMTKSVSFHKHLEKVFVIPHKADTLTYCLSKQPFNTKIVRFHPYTEVYDISPREKLAMDVEESCTTERHAKPDNIYVNDSSSSSSSPSTLPISYPSPSSSPSSSPKFPEIPISPTNHINYSTTPSHLITISSFALLPYAYNGTDIRESSRKTKTKTNRLADAHYGRCRKAASINKDTLPCPLLNGMDKKK